MPGSVHGRTSPARFCYLSCLHSLPLHAPQPTAELQLVKGCQLPAFPAQVTKWKAFCQEFCQVAEPSAKGSEALPRTLMPSVWHGAGPEAAGDAQNIPDVPVLCRPRGGQGAGGHGDAPGQGAPGAEAPPGARGACIHGATWQVRPLTDLGVMNLQCTNGHSMIHINQSKVSVLSHTAPNRHVVRHFQHSAW